MSEIFLSLYPTEVEKTPRKNHPRRQYGINSYERLPKTKTQVYISSVGKSLLTVVAPGVHCLTYLETPSY